MDKWKTEIAHSSEEETLVRGYVLEELISKLTFTEMIYLILKGETPTKKETRIMDAMLVAAAEHGIAAPSAVSARMVASGGNTFNSAVAAGILSFGEFHGGAIEGCAKLMQENISKKPSELVAEMKSKKQRIPGFGHKIYTTDPRTVELLKIAKAENISGKYVEFGLELEKELEKSSGKKLCINIDGALAILLSELGFEWKMANGFFVIARTPGLVAHVHEEMTKEKPFRRLENGKEY